MKPILHTQETPDSASSGAMPRSRDDRVYASEDLFQGGAIVRIEHGGDCYTLRRTRQGKLILTK